MVLYRLVSRTADKSTVAIDEFEADPLRNQKLIVSRLAAALSVGLACATTVEISIVQKEPTIASEADQGR